MLLNEDYGLVFWGMVNRKIGVSMFFTVMSWHDCGCVHFAIPYLFDTSYDFHSILLLNRYFVNDHL